MIHRLSDFSDLDRYELPFPLIKPHKLKYKDISLRIADEKWTTLRYLVKYKGKTFRVKEFFLDWFFTGFPKSLLRDFSSSYSEIENISVHGYTIFTGKNYRQRDSASAYIHGSQVEVDSPEEIQVADFKGLFLDLLEEIPDPGKLSNMQYPDRSHFAKSTKTSWYEEERISRLNWYRTSRYLLSMPGHSMRSCGIGFYGRNDSEHEILILEENQWKSMLWIESVKADTTLEHALYRVRPGEGFYDYSTSSEDGQEVIIFRQDLGPGVLHTEHNGHIFTIGFSPGFSLDDINYVSENMELVDSFLKKVREDSIQDREKL